MEKKYVAVKFDEGCDYNGKNYTYLTDLDLDVDDKVVIFSNFYKVATVVEVRGLTTVQRNKATKWIVAKIDITAHEERLRKAEIAQEIRNKLQEKREQAEEMLILRQLAKGDESIQKLLVELAEVDETVVLITE